MQCKSESVGWACAPCSKAHAGWVFVLGATAATAAVVGLNVGPDTSPSILGGRVVRELTKAMEKWTFDMKAVVEIELIRLMINNNGRLPRQSKARAVVPNDYNQSPPPPRFELTTSRCPSISLGGGWKLSNRSIKRIKRKTHQKEGNTVGLRNTAPARPGRAAWSSCRCRRRRRPPRAWRHRPPRGSS